MEKLKRLATRHSANPVSLSLVVSRRIGPKAPVPARTPCGFLEERRPPVRGRRVHTVTLGRSYSVESTHAAHAEGDGLQGYAGHAHRSFVSQEILQSGRPLIGPIGRCRHMSPSRQVLTPAQQDVLGLPKKAEAKATSASPSLRWSLNRPGVS